MKKTKVIASGLHENEINYIIEREESCGWEVKQIIYAHNDDCNEDVIYIVFQKEMK